MCRRTASQKRLKNDPELINNDNDAMILSTSSSFGHHYTNQQMLDALIRNANANDANFDTDFATRVFTKCGFHHRSVALSNPNDLFRRFSRSEYLKHRQDHLIGLAQKAGEMAIQRWGRPSKEITHLLWGTMTGGIHSPSPDVKLVTRLGLSKDVERTNMEGMGCLTGFRLLNTARQIAQADSNARILVLTADVRSALGNSLPKKCTREDIVSVALFTDSGSAAIVGGSASLQPNETPSYRIISGLSRVINDDHTAVNYFEGDDGSIRLHLARNLPDLIASHDKDFVDTLLKKSDNLTNMKIPPLSSQYFDILCHTGGPRVLTEVQKSLNMQKSDFEWSWNVMQNNGNLSGASNLAVLDCHNHHNSFAKSRSGWAICLSMGPGPCLEGVLLKSLHDNTPSQEEESFIPFANVPNVMIHNQQQEPPSKKKIVHIVGGGIAGMALAATLDPDLFNVRIFEASPNIQEKGYGIVLSASTLKILKDKFSLSDLDYFVADSMAVRVAKSFPSTFHIPFKQKKKNKAFISRNHLLQALKNRVVNLHDPDCISKNHRCTRVRFGLDEDQKEQVQATYETGENPCSIESCDLLIGADGINSVVRKYVALISDCRQFGSLTAYRFLIPKPSKDLLEETNHQWSMSIGERIHSPCYHVSREEGSTLSVVVLEYEGSPPSHPRPATY